MLEIVWSILSSSEDGYPHVAVGVVLLQHLCVKIMFLTSIAYSKDGKRADLNSSGCRC